MSAMTSMSELQAMPEAELRTRLAEVRKELAALRLRAKQGAVEQPHRIREIRREIARALTLLAPGRPDPRAAQQPPSAS